MRVWGTPTAGFSLIRASGVYAKGSEYVPVHPHEHMYVCMYVCMYIYLSIYIYICVCVCLKASR